MHNEIKKGSANGGRYLRIAWSKDWKTLTPWSLNGEIARYVSMKKDSYKSLFIFLGPIAIIVVNTK